MFFDNKQAVVGQAVFAFLTETQFQQQAGTEWVLADGRSATGTRYNSITGNANIPDMRGVYARGKNNGRSDGYEDTVGEQSIGTLEGDQTASHSHSIGYATGSGGSSSGLLYVSNGTGSGSTSTGTSGGGTETRVRSIVGNWFIKIN